VEEIPIVFVFLPTLFALQWGHGDEAVEENTSP